MMKKQKQKQAEEEEEKIPYPLVSVGIHGTSQKVVPPSLVRVWGKVQK